MNSSDARTLATGSALGVILTAVFYSRFDGSWLVLAATPLFLALATLVVEAFQTFDTGRGFGQRAGLGLGGWWCLVGAALCLALSFIT